MRIWIVFLVAIGSLFVTPEPVEASAVKVIIQASVGNQIGNLKKASRFVDKYTGTRFVYGYCRPQYRCIKVRVDRTRVKGTGYASWSGDDRKVVSIAVHPGRGSAYMTRLWAHELAHGMFVGHSTKSTNLMFPSLHKSTGKLVDFRFTENQKYTLRRH